MVNTIGNSIVEFLKLEQEEILRISSNNIFTLALTRQSTYPAAIIKRIVAPRTQSLEGQTGLVNAQMQIDSMAETAENAEALGNAIRLAMNLFKKATFSGLFVFGNDFQGDSDNFDETSKKIFTVSADYSIWYTEATA